jgi:aldehyde:ferredoxin oxidoreductase
MECGERGLLEGVPPFGDGAGLLALLEAIGRRQGTGDLLAEGTRRAAARIGRGAESFACHVKGLELPGYEPRTLKTLALGLAVGTRGADHNRSGAYEEDFRAGADRFRADPQKGEAAAASEDRAALLDSLILCKFLRHALGDPYAEAAAMLEAVTGWPLDARAMRETAERIVTLKKLYNEREGWTRSEDTLPERFLAEPLTDLRGPGAGARLGRPELDRMIRGYYRARGWTDEGRVPRARAAALGLADVLGNDAPGDERPAPAPAGRGNA